MLNLSNYNHDESATDLINYNIVDLTLSTTFLVTSEKHINTLFWP